MEEKELVARAKRGDKDAFSELYLQYNDRLYRYAFFKLGNRDDALDAVSTCIVEAYESLPKLRNDRAFAAWIFKILYRSCCSQVKRQLELKAQTDIDSLKNYDIDTYSFSYDTVELAEALKALSGEERDIVLLSAVAGCTSREIAQLMDMKAATVRSKLARSLAKMKANLE